MKLEHSEKAKAWYEAHKEHVSRLIAESDRDGYEPSAEPYRLGGDAHDPALWKPEHWKWFKQTHFVARRLEERK